MKKFTLRWVLMSITLLAACEKYDQDMSFLSPMQEGLDIKGDVYAKTEENPFVSVQQQPVSTFSVDADGASYANVRRFILQDRQKPPREAVRLEELINYFDLNYPYEPSAHPISLNGEVSSCPWAASHKLVRIGIKGKPLAEAERAASNFVFLIDVSGSMDGPDRLDLLKQGFNLLVDSLNKEDRVAIVTYAGQAGLALPATPGDERQKIKAAINALGSGGSTAGAAGIHTAYEIAQQNLIPGGNNRVILGTDGDFNVGVSSQEELVKLIEEKRKLGIFLTALGVGRGNLNDAALEQIANKGNGTYEYIDQVEQLRKVFVYETSKFYTVAKDVKVQVEFNPATVEMYRLIGYENRSLSKDDFADDAKDAGEIGAAQNITALYEIVPKNNISSRVDPTFTIRFRYKAPGSETSVPLTLSIHDQGKTFAEASGQMIFTASVASFGMLLTNSAHKGQTSYQQVLDWATKAGLPDEHGFYKEFEEIVVKAQALP